MKELVDIVFQELVEHMADDHFDPRNATKRDIEFACSTYGIAPTVELIRAVSTRLRTDL